MTSQAIAGRINGEETTAEVYRSRDGSEHRMHRTTLAVEIDTEDLARLDPTRPITITQETTMTDRTIAGEYTDAFKKYGLGGEEAHQTHAICHIADMLTAIAYDIRALREIANRKDDR